MTTLRTVLSTILAALGKGVAFLGSALSAIAAKVAPTAKA